MDDLKRARMLAVEVLLANPDALHNDALEADLYVLRDQLQAPDGYVKRDLVEVLANGAAACDRALGMLGAQDGGCPRGTAIGSAGFAGDGAAGPGPAEAAGLVIAKVVGSPRDPHNQAVPAVQAPVGTAAGRVCGGVPGWDTGQCFRWRGYLLSRRDRDRDECGGADADEGYAGQLAALGQHAGRDPRGRAHLGVPVGWRGPGQCVAAAFGGREPGDLRMVDEAGCFPDADHAAPFDAGVPPQRLQTRHTPLGQQKTGTK